MLPKKPYIRVFDPRKQQDYAWSLNKKQKVSTLKNNLFVVEYYPGREKTSLSSVLIQEKLTNLTKVSLLKVGAIGFFAVSPLTDVLKRSKHFNLRNASQTTNSVISYFNLNSENIESNFLIRDQLVSYEEWAIGSCYSKFNLPVEKSRCLDKIVSWDINFLLSQVGKIGCLSYFSGETGQTILFIKIYPEIDNFIEPLTSSLKQINVHQTQS